MVIISFVNWTEWPSDNISSLSVVKMFFQWFWYVMLTFVFVYWFVAFCRLIEVLVVVGVNVLTCLQDGIISWLHCYNPVLLTILFWIQYSSIGLVFKHHCLCSDYGTTFLWHFSCQSTPAWIIQAVLAVLAALLLFKQIEHNHNQCTESDSYFKTECYKNNMLIADLALPYEPWHITFECRKSFDKCK